MLLLIETLLVWYRNATHQTISMNTVVPYVNPSVEQSTLQGSETFNNTVLTLH